MRMPLLMALALTASGIRAAENLEDVARIQAEAASGVPAAQIELAREYLKGQFLPVDEAHALELIRAAADKAAAEAQFELAEMYASGMGEPRHNSETPFQLYLEAAKKGHGDAMVQLARRYRYGLGTDRDLLQAVFWTHRSFGRSPVRDLLDDKGEPLPRLAPEDHVFARFFSVYLKAWRTAEPATMLQVGRAFLEGRNGNPNLENAAFWLVYAARKGSTEAEKLAESVKEKLTPEQIRAVEEEISRVEAERRLRNTRPRK